MSFTMKIFTVLLFMACLNALGQSGVYQVVDVEKYQGKKFKLEGKIFYEGLLKYDSYAVLTAISLNQNAQLIKKPLYNKDAEDYYKEGDWSAYELTGKIDKKTKYLGVGVALDGSDSFYLDDFKLFVKDRKNMVEIPLKNAGFEGDSLTNWQPDHMGKGTKLSITKDKAFSGKQSYYIDNSQLEVAPTLGNNKGLGKYMDVNGVKLYYEVYGEGEPLLMLHGNNSNMGRFSNQVDVLSKKYKVIGLDSRGQGKSTSNDTKITYELMAEDVNTFLEKMQLKKVNILGWSDGGNTAVILAMQHPDKVNKMAITGTVLYNDNSSVTSKTNKILRQQVKEMEDRGVLKSNMNYRMKMLLLTEPHINPDALESIEAPTLVMAGQHDIIKERHTKLIADKIPDSKLVIFKGAGHEVPEEIPGLFNETVLEFFN